MLSNSQKIKMHNPNNINSWEWYADGEYLRERVINPNIVQKTATHYKGISTLMFVLSICISFYIAHFIIHGSTLQEILITTIAPIIITLVSLTFFKELSGESIASFPVAWDYHADTDSLNNIRRLPQVAAALNNYKFLSALKPENNAEYDSEYYHLLELVEKSCNSNWDCNNFRQHYNSNLSVFQYAPKNYKKYKEQLYAQNPLGTKALEGNLHKTDNSAESSAKRMIPGSEENVLNKLVGEFPETSNFTKMILRLAELSATDYQSFTVIVHEVTTHYYNIMKERENNNKELADAMLREFKPLLNKTVIIVNRMTDTINQVKLDEIAISNTFIGDKFHLMD